MVVTTYDALPRWPLAALPTPLVRAPRLGERLGLDLWIKRDDLTGFATAGNKARALELLLGDALRAGCDHVVGCGGPSSNLCAGLALASATAGLRCTLVLYGDGTGTGHPNLTVARAAGAAIVHTGDPDRETVEPRAAEVAADLRAGGARPYVVPRGGATPVGAAGFAIAAAELAAQRAPAGARVVIAAGSGASAAGLLAGLAATGADLTVVAAAVSRPVADTRRRIVELAAACADLVGGPHATETALGGRRLRRPRVRRRRSRRRPGGRSGPAHRGAPPRRHLHGQGGRSAVTASGPGRRPDDLLAHRGLGRRPRRTGRHAASRPRPSVPPEVGDATGPADELVEGGFAIESADAPVLHDGLNLADLAHVLDLRSRRLLPDAASVALISALLDIDAVPADEFPYDPRHGETYNSRERVLVERLGDTAGWLHAGRPRREATRVAFRLFLRREISALAADVADLGTALADQARRHADVLFPDQTYLQQAQPSTVGHYLLAFAYPLLRDGDRLIDTVDWVNRSPGGAGCVNGSRLLEDRSPLAELLGFDGVITHTRDAMWQTDGLVQLLATSASLASTQDALAEDLEIWASAEFDFVDLDDAHTRASVLMPQKRNPYALSMIRGATGVLIGRLAGFLSVQKAPSARSDKLIFAYGEVPKAIDSTRRLTRLARAVVAGLRWNEDRMRAQLDRGFSQATDVAEVVMISCGLDYRTAYRLVGRAVRQAAAEGKGGAALGSDLLDRVAEEELGAPLGLDPDVLAAATDPASIVATRTAVGGAAHEAVLAMVDEITDRAEALRVAAGRRATAFARAESTLRNQARAVAVR